MVPGFRGHLIAEDALERALAAEPAAGAARSIGADWREAQSGLGPASSLRAMVERGAMPLAAALGFSESQATFREADYAALALRASDTPLIALVTRWGERLDPLWRHAIAEASARGAEWAFLFNGVRLRLLQTGRLHSRRFVEFDLDTAADDERTRRAMAAILTAEALSANEQSRCRTGLLIESSDRQGVAVCRALKDGVLEASEEVLATLIGRSARPDLAHAFDQALTIVYRLLFLFFAEARWLVPLWHPIYRESYSVQALRDDALRRESVGLWQALRAIGRLAHAGCRAGDLRVTPFNGRLFALKAAPLAERTGLDDGAARRALLALSTRPAADGEARVTLSYRDLGVEQLGSIYETLLDYQPVRSRSGNERTVTLKPGSGVRKRTGTFYTPEGLARFLVRQALAPLVRNATPDRILQLRVLDPSMGSGAFLVAACRYLADAYEDALVESGGCLSSDLGRRERAAIRRQIAERCLFGVDSNPMAVQLARLSLWLATLSADRPLSFLDHHLVTGDSLLGAWLTCLRQAPGPRRRDTALPLFDAEPWADVVHRALPVRFRLEQEASDTPEAVRRKERALATLNADDGPLARWKRIADLWCAHWFTRDRPPVSAFGALCDVIAHGRGVLPTATAERFLAASRDAASSLRLFHWELEFPEVFFDADGRRRPDAGFDAVIGNPPWDMVRADADGDEDARRSDRAAAIVRFTREAGVYAAQSAGHANRYQMFVERSLALTRQGGSLALVLPFGLALDAGSAALRRMLFSRATIDSLVGFDNRHAIFPIHRSVKFLALSARAGGPTERVRCRFGETTVAALEAHDIADARRFYPVTLGRTVLEQISGDDLTIPDFRTPLDLSIAERAAACFAPLGSDQSWGARFGRELNATDDRGFFRPARRGLPVLGGRHIEPFRPLPKLAERSIGARDATRLLGRAHQRGRLAYRDVASPANRTTLIAALLPAGCVSTHTLFCLKTRLPVMAQHFLCGVMNSFVVNFLVRLRVSTHVTTTLVERLPVPSGGQAGPLFHEIAGAARALARRHDPSVAANLNAWVARLYGLSHDDLAHVLTSFPLVPETDRERVGHTFRALR